jgi:hypothetical protein
MVTMEESVGSLMDPVPTGDFLTGAPCTSEACGEIIPPAVVEMALGFRRLRLSNRDLFVNTSSALPVDHTPWVGQAGRERRAPVSRFCQGGRGTGVRASYAPRRRREVRTRSRNGVGASSGGAGFGLSFGFTTAGAD